MNPAFITGKTGMVLKFIQIRHIGIKDIRKSFINSEWERNSIMTSKEKKTIFGKKGIFRKSYRG